MHILICDDDAAFAAQMDEYISEWFRAREKEKIKLKLVLLHGQSMIFAVVG